MALDQTALSVDGEIPSSSSDQPAKLGKHGKKFAGAVNALLRQRITRA